MNNFKSILFAGIILLIPLQISYADYDSFTVNVPNSQGGYTAIIIKKSGNGYTGPQGEFYSEFPTITKLQGFYNLNTSNSNVVVNPNNTIQSPEFIPDDTKIEDMAQALIRYLSMGYNVLETPNEQGNLKNDYSYSLDNMQVLDHLQNDGVLICVSGMNLDATPIAFLYTNDNLNRGDSLHGLAHFVGVKHFHSSIGDEKDIPTFRMN